MTIKTCVFDVNGNLINIGEWDERIQPVQVGTDENGEPIFEDQPTNPLPDGAYTEEREVVQDADGGWRLADDYRELRKTAYSIQDPWEVIDEIMKQITPEPGSRLEQIQQERLAVKAQYPKPE